MKIDLSEHKLLFLLLVVIGILFLISATTRGFIWDEAHHANPALFVYNIMNDQPQDIIEYAIEYHAHYKFFSVFASYPPMNMILVSGAYSLLEPNILVSRLVAIIETLVMLFFVFKLAKLYSRDNKYLPFLCVIFTALHPVIFLFSPSNLLDGGLTLFIVAGTYFFVKFLRTENHRYLFFTAIMVALGIMTKVPMVLFFIPILLTMVFERKLYLFHKHGTGFLKAFLILLLFISPFITQLAVLRSEGMIDIFTAHWNKPSDTGLLESLAITDPGLIQNSLGVVFYQWFLVPFLILGVILMLRKRREIDKLLILTMVFFLWFYTSNIINNPSDPRFIMPIIPFVVIAACYGLVNISKWFGSRGSKIFVLGVMVLLAASQSYAYTTNSDYYYIPNLDSAAIFVIEHNDYVGGEPTTVLTTWGQPQMFEFARLDSERKIYTMYMPEKEENIIRAINNDFSYYGSKELWDSVGLVHPDPDYVILHEKALREKYDTYDYDIDYFESRPEFELLKVIEGNEAYDRIFIYKILH